MKRSKYGAVATFVDNIRFASKREAVRYVELKVLQQAKEISNLKAEKPDLRIPLKVNGVNMGYYEADFSYTDANGNVIFEDVKGVKTPVYRLKKKLVKAMYGIDIVEV